MTACSWFELPCSNERFMKYCLLIRADIIRNVFVARDVAWQAMFMIDRPCIGHCLGPQLRVN